MASFETLGLASTHGAASMHAHPRVGGEVAARRNFSHPPDHLRPMVAKLRASWALAENWRTPTRATPRRLIPTVRKPHGILGTGPAPGFKSIEAGGRRSECVIALRREELDCTSERQTRHSVYGAAIGVGDIGDHGIIRDPEFHEELVQNVGWNPHTEGADKAILCGCLE